MAFNGYFSDSVLNIITTKAKLNSQKYIEEVIVNEVLPYDMNLFYQSVSNEGVISASFDVAKCNLILTNTMNKLRKISTDFNDKGSFKVDVPVSYLFISTSYLFPSFKLNVETSNLLYYDVDLKADIKEYGINSSLVSVNMVIEISYQVIVPLMVKIIDDKIEIPLALEIINGKVPDVLFSY